MKFSHHSSQTPFPKGFFHSPFKPALLLKHPHLQTLFASVNRRTLPSITRQRKRVSLADGDFIILDYKTPATLATDAPLVLVIHGLSGSSDSHYVIGLQNALAAQGWPSVAMNCRGATEPNMATRAYHAGASDDVIAVFNHLSKSQNRNIVIVGYSLGGSMTLKALSELGQHPRLLAGVSVSAPLELEPCAYRLDSGFSMIYRQHLLEGLEELWHAKHQYLLYLGQKVEAQKIADCLQHAPFKSFWQFDDLLMAPLHGFANVNDYYQRCRPNQFLKDIKVPTLIIHALDDPFMSVDVVPAQHDLSPMIYFELAKHGGHVGFIGGTANKPNYYLEQRIPEFLGYLVKEID